MEPVCRSIHISELLVFKDGAVFLVLRPHDELVSHFHLKGTYHISVCATKVLMSVSPHFSGCMSHPLTCEHCERPLGF